MGQKLISNSYVPQLSSRAVFELLREWHESGGKLDGGGT